MESSMEQVRKRAQEVEVGAHTNKLNVAPRKLRMMVIIGFQNRVLVKPQKSIHQYPPMKEQRNGRGRNGSMTSITRREIRKRWNMKENKDMRI